MVVRFYLTVLLLLTVALKGMEKSGTVEQLATHIEQTYLGATTTQETKGIVELVSTLNTKWQEKMGSCVDDKTYKAFFTEFEKEIESEVKKLLQEGSKEQIKQVVGQVMGQNAKTKKSFKEALKELFHRKKPTIVMLLAPTFTSKDATITEFASFLKTLNKTPIENIAPLIQKQFTPPSKPFFGGLFSTSPLTILDKVRTIGLAVTLVVILLGTRRFMNKTA